MTKAAVRTSINGLRRLGVLLSKTIFRGRSRRPLYESNLLDDFLMGQPLNVIARWERYRAIRNGIAGDEQIVSVVIVNYNTLDQLRTTVRAVRLLSPSGTEIVVVDNGSTDGSAEWLGERPYDIEPVRLRTNLGHGRALDIAICRSRGCKVVTLDSDAFPVSNDWMTSLLEHLSDDVRAVGMWGPRDRLHPALAAMQRRDYFELNLSFAGFQLIANPPVPEFGVNCWDTGELISEAIGADHTVLLDCVDSEFHGQLIPGLAYHHCGVTTLATDPNDSRRGTKHDELWHAAVDHYLKPGRGLPCDEETG